MAIGTINITGTIDIQRFQIILGNYLFNEAHTQLIIPYTAYGNPDLVADLTTYEYSLDGSTWSTMTAATGTVVTDLDFTSTGESQSFTWEIKSDIGDDIYNRNIYIKFQATSGTLSTTVANYSVYFAKIIVNETTVPKMQLPEDYQGIAGADLLKNAPKTGK